MRRTPNWQIALGATLLMLSAFVAYVHYRIFHDARYIESYFIAATAFAFIEVFLVTIVLNGILTLREKRALLKKLNMVIGAFFSEAGAGLIRRFAAFDAGFGALTKELSFTGERTVQDLARMRVYASAHASAIDCARGDLAGLKVFLVARRPFLLGLLENQNLLEHESFTNLLWAVFHLTEELEARASLAGLPASDYMHLAGDIKRAYDLLIVQWVSYMNHLKTDYPYLFSLAARTNPFDRAASAVVQ